MQVTSLEYISGDGRAITLIVIHKGTKPLTLTNIQFPLYKDYLDQQYGFIDKGQTDNIYSLNQLTKIFIPKSYYSLGWRILLIDNHNSYTIPEF